MSSELSNSEEKEALNLITMVKEKRDGKIRGRACVDEWEQCWYISRDEVSSSTPQLENLMNRHHVSS